LRTAGFHQFRANSVADRRIDMARLLILEDRKKDAESLMARKPIRDQFLTDGSSPIYLPNLESLTSTTTEFASVVVAQTLEVGLRIIQRETFDLVISDLLLFDPTLVNAIDEDDYFRFLPIEDRRREITKPSGLRFLEELRSRGVGTAGTGPDVPIIAMTFFWRHPRFQALYIKQIRSVRKPAIGYLPKYYWVGNSSILDKGDEALRVLIKVLKTRDDELNRELLPMFFDALALDLFVFKNRFDLHDALHILRTSYDDSCRSIVEFELIFRLGNIQKPEDSSDIFKYVMEKLKDGATDGVAIELKFHNVPTATEVVGARNRKERKLIHPDKGDLLTMHSRGEKANEEKAAKIRTFGICWALALYTYPLAQGPHCLSLEALADLLSAHLGEGITKGTIKSDINRIRNELQRMLPAAIKEFVSAENHLIVTEGKDGYYLNGTYDEHWGR
jgi:hypothetical protein